MNIKIGPVVYRIAEMRNEHMIGSNSEGKAISLNGDIAHHDLCIRVNADNNPHIKVITIWHEILHAILHQAGHRDHSESHIEALAYGLVAVVRDNPDLIDKTKYTSTADGINAGENSS